MAIPVFNGRVAPVFDWAHQLVVVDYSAGTELGRQDVALDRLSATKRPEYLRALGVDVLVCGGVSNELLALLESRDIRVFAWLSGQLDEVLQHFATSEGRAGPQRSDRAPTDTGSPSSARRGNAPRRNKWRDQK